MKRSTVLAAPLIAAIVLSFVPHGLLAGDLLDVLGPAPGEYQILDSDSIIEIPFKVFRGDILMDGEVNGRPVRMMIDNGFLWDQILFFGSPLIDSLELDYDGQVEVGGSGGGEPVASRTASGVTISFPGVVFTNQAAIITPYSSGMSDMWRGTEGQVSATFFKHFVVAMDFDRGTLSLFEPGKFNGASRGLEVPLKHVFNNSWSIPAEIEFYDGRKLTMDLAMDLGYGDELQLVPGPENDIVRPDQCLEASLGFGIQGETRGCFGRLKSVTIGGTRLKGVIAAFVAPDYREYEFHEATIGLGLLARFNVTFDYPHGRIFLEPNDRFSEPFEYNMSGITMRRGHGEFLNVENVYPESPASEAGLTVGDSVVTINGRPAVGYDVWEIRELMRQEGKSVTLELMKGGEKVEARLTLRRLL